MKTVSVPTDWLREIDGKSVADAIAFLSTLPSDHVLSYWQSGGDDQGVEISSELTYQSQYTDDELAELAERRKIKRIQDRKRAIAYYEEQQAFHTRRGDLVRAESYKLLVAEYKLRLRNLT